jgi:hypothetical protein
LFATLKAHCSGVISSSGPQPTWPAANTIASTGPRGKGPMQACRIGQVQVDRAPAAAGVDDVMSCAQFSRDAPTDRALGAHQQNPHAPVSPMRPSRGPAA